RIELLLDVVRLEAFDPGLRRGVFARLWIKAWRGDGVVDVDEHVAGNAVAADDEDLDVAHLVQVLVVSRLGVRAVVREFGAPAEGQSTNEHTSEQILLCGLQVSLLSD